MVPEVAKPHDVSTNACVASFYNAALSDLESLST